MSDFNEKFNDLMNTENVADEFSDEDIQKNKGISCLSYWGILILVPLFTAKDSPFAKFHANQGLLFLLFNVAYGIASGVLNIILGWIPVVGWIVSLILNLGSVAIFVYAIILTVNTSKGQAKELPVIGHYRLIK